MCHKNDIQPCRAAKVYDIYNTYEISVEELKNGDNSAVVFFIAMEMLPFCFLCTRFGLVL